MGKAVVNHIQESIETKRHNLDKWLETAPPSDKIQCLCENEETALQDHIEILDQTLEKTAEGTLGVCQICHGQIETNLLEMDYTASICLDCLSTKQRKDLEMELEFSSQVQRALLPQQAPSVPGLEIGAFARPAQIIGGDYFDFIDYQNGSHGLVVADVMGHGVSASILMSGLQAALQTLIPETNSPQEVMRKVNRHYLHNVNLTTFITTFLGQFDSEKGTLTYCNAGHNPPLLLKPINGREFSQSWLRPTAAAIGLMEDYSPGTDTVLIQAGDILVLYTDGLTEAVNAQGVPFGLERLVDASLTNASLSSQEMAAAIKMNLNTFTGDIPLADDVTTVVCKVI